MKQTLYTDITQCDVKLISNDEYGSVIEFNEEKEVYSPAFGTVLYTHKTSNNKYCILIKCNTQQSILIDDLIDTYVGEGEYINQSQNIGKGKYRLTIVYLSKEPSLYYIRLLDKSDEDTMWYKHNTLPLLNGQQDLSEQINSIYSLNTFLLSNEVQGVLDDETDMSETSLNILTNNKGE